MCGIVYGHNQDNLKSVVWEQYKNQKNRGTQGFGLFDGTTITRAATEKRISRWFRRKQNKPSMLLFHHRYPTSTANVKRAAHPFNTGDYFGDTKYVMVHNGVIRNPKELREKHEGLGIEYQSVLHDGKYNDSEALMWELALTLEGQQEKIEAYGDMAFVCVKLEKGESGKLYFGRNFGRPLNLHQEGSGMLLSSEGKGKSIDTSKLYTYDYETNKLESKIMMFPMYQPFDDTKKTNNRTYSYNYDYDYQFDGYGNGWTVDSNGYAVYDDGDYDFTSSYKGTSTSSQTTFGFGNVLLQTEPTDSEVNAEYFRLLAQTNGVFKDASTLGLAELDMAEEMLESGEKLSSKEKREIKAQYEAVKLLEESPDWIDAYSVHPMWAETANNDNLSLARTLTQAALAVGRG